MVKTIEVWAVVCKSGNFTIRMSAEDAQELFDNENEFADRFGGPNYDRPVKIVHLQGAIDV